MRLHGRAGDAAADRTDGQAVTRLTAPVEAVGDDAAGSKAVREDHSAFRHDGLRLFIGHRAARRLQNLRPHCHPVERRFELLPVRRSAEAVLKFAFGRGVVLSKSPAKPFLTRRVVRRDQPRSPRRESYSLNFPPI